MIVPVQTEQDIATVVKLAKTIWHEHYTPIIGSDQVSYMLKNFHSQDVIKDEIDNKGYLYFLIRHRGRFIGYMGVQPLQDDSANHLIGSAGLKDTDPKAVQNASKSKGILFLSKLYILSSERSRGIGRMAIGHLVELADKLELYSIRLTVNKNNALSITAYEKMGFKHIDNVLDDIGGGYVMDDVVMELVI